MKNKKNIPVYEPFIDDKEIKYAVSCIKSGWISSTGKFVDRFAEEFAKFLNIKYAVPVSNGTAALHLALQCLKIKPGDEVIVPALTFASTANAVIYTGAKPVFVDVRLDNYALDENMIEEKITNKTKAIIPVHLYGFPANLTPILKIAKKYNLYVIEDAAEAHGAEYKGKKVGSIGDIGCFSFYGNKVITTGEGGMVVTNNKKYAERIKFLRSHAMKTGSHRYWHTEVGYNYRLTALQSAIGLAQLTKIKTIIQKKCQIAEKYQKGLSNINDIILPKELENCKSIWWLYTFCCKNQKLRDSLIKYLKTKGIDTRPVFYPLPIMPPYKDKFIYSNANLLSKTGLSLPSWPGLPNEDIDYIVSSIKSFFKKNE